MMDAQNESKPTTQTWKRVGAWGAVLAGSALFFGERSCFHRNDTGKEAEISLKDSTLPPIPADSEKQTQLSSVDERKEPTGKRKELTQPVDPSTVNLKREPFSLPVKLISSAERKVTEGSLTLHVGDKACSVGFNENKPSIFTAKALQKYSVALDAPIKGYLDVKAFGFLPLEKYPCNVQPGTNDEMTVILNPGLIVNGKVLEFGTTNPVNNASVRIDNPDGGYTFTGVTNKTGEVISKSGPGLSGIDPRWPELSLTVSAEGFADDQETLSGGTSSFVVYLDRGASFNFTLIDSSTKLPITPLKGTVVQLESNGDMWSSEGFSEEKNESFEIKNVQTKKITTLIIREKGYEARTVKVDALHPNSQDSSPNKIILDPAVELCTVRLINEKTNAPFSGAYFGYAAITDLENGKQERRNLTDSWTEDPTSPGTYRLKSDHENFPPDLKEVCIYNICTRKSSETAMKCRTANGPLPSSLTVWDFHDRGAPSRETTIWVTPPK